MNDSDLDQGELSPGSFEFPLGFLAFVSAMMIPAIAAMVIVIGASLFAGEVRAADAQNDVGSLSTSATSNADGSRFNVAATSKKEVAGWKRTLVGICPLH